MCPQNGIKLKAAFAVHIQLMLTVIDALCFNPCVQIWENMRYFKKYCTFIMRECNAGMFYGRYIVNCVKGLLDKLGQLEVRFPTCFDGLIKVDEK